MKRLAWHFDFHSHKNIRIGHNPDPDGMARALREAGVEEMATFAKGHNGFAYYPTQVGTVHPQMKGDPFGDVVNACKTEDIDVVAYISFGIDGEAGRKHNEWVQVSAGGPILNDDWFISLCPFTPYTDELMMPQIREVLENYPVDGLFFDTMGALGTCYCDCCQADFKALHGSEIPRDPEMPNWRDYGWFRHERGIELLNRVASFIADVRPGTRCGFNQIGTMRFPEPMPEGISHLSLDFTTSGPQSLQASAFSAYGSTSGLPAEVMSTIFNGGWGDWSPRPPAGLEQEAVAVWARNCRPYIGARIHPENRFDPVVTGALTLLGDLQNRVAAAYPEDDARLTPDILLLHGPYAMYGPDFSRFAHDRAGIDPLLGAHRLLLDSGANFAIVAEHMLTDHIGQCKLLILPEAPGIDPSTAVVIRDYVEKGGQVLLVGQVPIAGDSRLPWTGVTAAEAPWQDHIYLPAWDDDALPVLVRGDFYAASLNGAECILSAIRPYDCDHGVRFGWGIGPPSTEPSEHPALTCFTSGKGKVWHLAAPIFRDYVVHMDWTQMIWFRTLLTRLLPDAAATVVTETGLVELVLHANENSTWAFLVNHTGEQLAASATRVGQAWSRTLRVPAQRLTLTLRDAAGREPSRVTFGGVPVAFSMDEDAVVIDTVLEATWSVARVDWA